MISFFLRVTGACLLLGGHTLAASVPTNYQVVEDLGSVPEGWSLAGAPSASTLLRFRLAVYQPRAGEFEKMVENLSTPGHTTYGHHMKREEVKEFLRPTIQTSQSIRSWLHAEGITDGNIEDHGDWINFATRLDHAEDMLNTRFYYFQSDFDDTKIIRTLGYSVPAVVSPHVHMVQPTTRFGHPQRHGTTVFRTGLLASQNLEKDDCTTVVTPSCIRDLYKIDRFAGPDPRNKLGVSGYLDQYARYADFAQFLKRYAPELAGTSFEVQSINGGQNLQNSSLTSTEASLDIDYAISLSNATAVYYTTGGRGPLVPDLDQPDPNEVSNEPFLDQLHYLLSLKDEELPSILTTSYGENEQSVPAKYTNATCNLFSQLGARGVSVIFSSGDDGPGNSCQTNDGKNTTRFNPIFPAACPFVTSVGGTVLTDVESAVYFSSGGFSDRHARPSYQETAVKAYLDQLGNRWEGLYNPSGRGFPDVAALGQNFSVYDHGEVLLLSGTSASAPLFAAIIANLNAARLEKGKRVLGFLNPFIYSLQRGSGFKDIVHGGSTGCRGKSRTSGLPTTWVPYASWNATSGWDPVTGVGTPEFDMLLESALGLE